MVNQEHPCARGLTRECFKYYPAWAKQAFAHRLMHTLVPAAITRRLPKGLRRGLIGPGVVVPPGAVVPPGVVVPPGTLFPEGWTPGDPLPESVPPPPAETVPIPPTGATPPIYTEPWSPGPIVITNVSPAGEVTAEFEGSTSDGRVSIGRATWLLARDATTGGSVESTLEARNAAMIAARYVTSFYVGRSFFYFDLSSIPASKTVQSVALTLTAYLEHGSSVSVQQGTQADPLTGDDIDSFTGSYFDYKSWVDGVNRMPFNQGGIDYIQSVLGGTVKLCCREYAHDYLNAAPAAFIAYIDGCYYQESADASKRPKLEITYK